MAIRKIIWTTRAKKSFNEIIEYINNNFGEKVTRSFVQATYKHVERLVMYPALGTLQNEKRGVLCFVISKHNTVYYRITDNEIIILNLFSNRKNPKKNKY